MVYAAYMDGKGEYGTYTMANMKIRQAFLLYKCLWLYILCVCVCMCVRAFVCSKYRYLNKNPWDELN